MNMCPPPIIEWGGGGHIFIYWGYLLFSFHVKKPIPKRAKANCMPSLCLEIFLRSVLCNASFLLDPQDGGISDKHPFSMCFLNLLGSVTVESGRLFSSLNFSCSHFSKKLSSCCRILLLRACS